MNEVYLMGHLGKDPESKQITDSSICKFSLATTERYKNASGAFEDHVEWHQVVVFGKVADICSKSLKKGSKVLVRGKVSYRQWEDKNGVTQYMTQIKGKMVEFLSPRQDSVDKKPEVNATYTTSEIPF